MGIVETKSKNNTHPQTRLGHCGNSSKNLRFNPHPDCIIVKIGSNAAASNKAVALQKPNEAEPWWKTHKENRQQSCSFKQGWSIAEQAEEQNNAPATNKTGALQTMPENKYVSVHIWPEALQQSTDNRRPSLERGWSIAKNRRKNSHKQDWGMAKSLLRSTLGLKHHKKQQKQKQRPGLKQGLGNATPTKQKRPSLLGWC